MAFMIIRRGAHMKEQKQQTTINEPKKHHYIPRLILKYFHDENNQVLYWDIDKETLEKRNIKSLYMNKNMYRDEKNHPDNPTSIEKEFGLFEAEIADLLSKKMFGETVTITRAELEKLRIFMGLLSFRSDLRMKQYKEKMFDRPTEILLNQYQKDGDYEDLWKKELSALAKCRTYEDIKENKDINQLIKSEFLLLIEGYYMTIIDARGGEFIMSDVYPTVEMYRRAPGVNSSMHEFYPISPTRMLLLNNIVFKKQVKERNDPFLEPMIKTSKIGGQSLKEPRVKYSVNGLIHKPEDLFTYKPVKVYEPEIKYINSLILNESRIGIMFKNPERVLGSVSSFNANEKTIIKHTEFEKELQKLCDLQSSGADSKI